MCPQYRVHRDAHGGERRVLQPVFGIKRREPRREQQRVALSQRNFQLLGEQHHHIPARLRLAAFDEADVALRYARVEREIELTAPAPLPPLAQLRADRAREDPWRMRRGLARDAPTLCW